MERTKKFVVLQKKEHTKNISDLRFRFCCYKKKNMKKLPKIVN